MVVLVWDNTLFVVPPYGSLFPNKKAPQTGDELRFAKTQIFTGHAGKVPKILVPPRISNFEGAARDHPSHRLAI